MRTPSKREMPSAIVWLAILLVVVVVALVCVALAVRCTRAELERLRRSDRETARHVRDVDGDLRNLQERGEAQGCSGARTAMLPAWRVAVECSRPLALGVRVPTDRERDLVFKVLRGSVTSSGSDSDSDDDNPEPSARAGDVLWTSEVRRVCAPWAAVRLVTNIVCPPPLVVVQAWEPATRGCGNCGSMKLISTIELVPQCGVGQPRILEPQSGSTWIVYPEVTGSGGWPALRVLMPPPPAAGPETIAITIFADLDSDGVPDTSCVVTLDNPQGLCVLGAGVVQFAAGARDSTVVTVPIEMTATGVALLSVPGPAFDVVVELTSPAPVSACGQAPESLHVRVVRGVLLDCTLSAAEGGSCGAGEEGAPISCPDSVAPTAPLSTLGALGRTSTASSGATTIVGGGVGASPGAVTGFPPGTATGGVASSGTASAAQTQLGLAYADAASRPDGQQISRQLGGATLPCGVYSALDGDFAIDGTLTLDGHNADGGAVFVFQSAGALTTAVGSQIVLANGATPCSVVWQIGGSASLGAGSAFAGALMAQGDVATGAGVSVNGWLWSRGGTVNLNSTAIVVPSC